MTTILPFDPYVPQQIVLDPPLTDAQFEEFCGLNSEARIERTREGAILVMSPTAGATGSGNADLSGQLFLWWRTHRRGRVYDSNSGFYLPDGAMLSPDAAYVTQEKVARYTKRDYKSFPRVCPDFVAELVSESDPLKKVKAKMERWAENGAAVGWLLDPDHREVLVYGAPGKTVTAVSGDWVHGTGPVEGFALDLRELWSFFPY